MATKKSAPAKTAAKAPAKPALKPAPKTEAVKAAAPKPDTAKKAMPKAKDAVKVTKAPAPAAKAPAKPKGEPAKAVKAAKPEPKAPAKPKAKSAAPKADAKAKATSPAPKVGKKATPAPKPVAKALKAESKVAAKATPEPAAKEPKANGAATAKPAKTPKPAKAPKLAPVAAAFAKPPPAKPLAVAAGRAQPVAMAPLTTPVRQAPRPLAAPKPTGAEPETVGDLKTVPPFKGKAGAAKGMVLVGAIAGAFGVKGEVRLRAFTEKKDGVISYGPLYGEDGKVILKPKNWRELKDGVAVVAPEVKSREDAEKLKGVKLYVPRSNLPNLPPEKDEYYWVDLMGCRAETLDGAALGEVVAVWNFGAGDILELRPPNGGQNMRITFTKTNVPLVDPVAKRIVIDPPAPEPMEK